jgi:CbiD
MAWQQRGPLRRGWTTGAFAAATRAAFTALLSDRFPDPVSIRSPRGGTASFRLAQRHCHDLDTRRRAPRRKNHEHAARDHRPPVDPGDDWDCRPVFMFVMDSLDPNGIDVACAAGLDHIAASTGTTSEQALQRLYDLPDHALIDLGGFVGGALKYLRAHPVARLTIAGGHLALAGSRERALARLVAARAREGALATLSGKTAVDVAIADREGEFPLRVGG